MEVAGKQRMCVCCGKPLLASSKMTEEKIAVAEAQEHGWTGTAAGPEAVTVAMCLQCQIVRAERRKSAGTRD